MSLHASTNNFRLIFSIVHTNATGAHMSSFGLAVMIPIYRACNEQSGTGSQQRMHDIMEAKMQECGLFKQIRISIRNDLEKAIDETVHKVTTHVMDTCAKIKQEIHTVTSTSVRVSNRCPEIVTAVRRLVELTNAEWRRIHEDTEPVRKQARLLGYVE